jgi:hypothetical protein
MDKKQQKYFMEHIWKSSHTVNRTLVDKENQPITAPTKNWRLSASYDSFVVNQTFVLRMNICGKNRQLLVAAKRCVLYCLTERSNKKHN